MATNKQTNRTTTKKKENKRHGTVQNNVQRKSTFHTPTSQCFFQSIYIKYLLQTNGITIYVLQLAFFFLHETIYLGFLSSSIYSSISFL